VKPLVSVITVCLNSASTVARAVESVLSQTYENVEYIFIDGASTDGTLDVLQPYRKHFSFFSSEKDNGIYSAMNKGLSVTRGDLIIFLNSDDWYEESALAVLISAYSQTHNGFVSARARAFSDMQIGSTVIPSFPWDASIRFRMPLRHETMLVSKDLYKRFGPYNECFRVISDFLFTLELYEHGVSHHEVDEVILNFNTKGISSVALDLLYQERKVLMTRQFPFLNAHEVSMVSIHGRMGPDDALSLAKKYPCEEKLVRSIAALCRDKISRGERPWTDRRADLLSAGVI
jgi:glycosyltransferase involved in cell wall biosynthesis